MSFQDNDDRPDWLANDKTSFGPTSTSDPAIDANEGFSSSIEPNVDDFDQTKSTLPPLQRVQSILGIFSLLLSPCAIILVSLWVQNEAMGGGGVSWMEGDAKRVFNWHPILMVSAYSIMNVGVLIFRASGTSSYHSSLANSRASSEDNAVLAQDSLFDVVNGIKGRKRGKMKLIHVIIWSLSFVLGLVAMLAVFKSHNDPVSGYIANLYSLHSWIGVVALTLFLCQFLAGIISFGGLMRGCGSSPVMMEMHKYTGTILHTILTATVLLGIQEKEGFVQCAYTVTEADLMPILNVGMIPTSCKLSHSLGMVVLFMGIFTNFALAKFPVL